MQGATAQEQRKLQKKQASLRKTKPGLHLRARYRSGPKLSPGLSL
jgi:hypothetical protein